LELRRLSAELLRSQDEERRRIGRELHDSTAQNLGALSAMLHQLRELASPLHREARKLLSESKALADVCIREVRTLSYVLHPAMLDASGLEDAIRHFVDGYTERTGIQVELEISPTVDRMEHTTELSLFRIVQESLTNIQRHSGSPYARIRLVRNQDCLILEVIDVGRKHSEGIRRQHGAASFRHGVGIPSMQERAKAIGARIDTDSGGNGTTVRVTIPLGEE
jgi:two-component system NarL family sensor kinase